MQQQIGHLVIRAYGNATPARTFHLLLRHLDPFIRLLYLRESNAFTEVFP
jgi:hypothetical protein